MMRSFGAREDCSVFDEPFFAPYLKVTGKAHPGREETLASHETDPFRAEQLCLATPATPYYFQKHMPQHMLDGFPMDWAQEAKHFFLIRDPRRVIASYILGRADFEIEDLGFASQRRLWETLGRPPIVDSLDILRDPEVMLKKLCSAIDIKWDANMLSWDAGPRAEDGAWAPYWYASVQRSTGFAPPPKSPPAIDEIHQAVLDAVQEDFDVLFKSRLQIQNGDMN
jgi:hypothetical protein